MIEVREVPGQTCRPSVRKAVFRCRCGVETTALRSNVKRGHTKSCGCLRAGFSLHPLYHTWQNMMKRCYNPNCPRYDDYGGRGIRVCDRWHDVANFIADLGDRPEGHTLDRKDNEGDYCPENCQWATAKEQRANRRPQKNTRRLTAGGETKTLKEWASATGVPYNTIKTRLRRGKTPMEAIQSIN